LAYINIALDKGRLADEALRLFKQIGLEFPEYARDSRKLIFTDKQDEFRMVLVKGSDVPTYVAKGAADIGVVGKDMLLDEEPDIYELVDLGFGKCRFVVAGRDASCLNKQKLVVASKYPRVAKSYFLEQGRSVETITLHGSVELAPLVGLADCIVDIVETGRTLKENGLKVLREMFPISARLIANKASMKTKFARLMAFVQDVQQIVNGEGVFGS